MDEQKKTVNTPPDLVQARLNFIDEYNRIIRENNYSIDTIIEKMEETGLTVPKRTLLDTINKGRMNVKIVVAFCHRFNVDINKIFFPDNKTMSESRNKNTPCFLYSKDFIDFCLKSKEDIESVYMTFRSGGEWLEQDNEKALLSELNNKRIMVKVIVNHGKAIKEMTDSMYTAEEKKMSLDVNDCVRLWGKFEENFNNLEVCISDLPILRRLTIVNFKNRKSKIFVRDYAYNFSEGWENASFTYDENDYLTDTFKKEFDYLWSKGRSFKKWVIDETNKSGNRTISLCPRRRNRRYRTFKKEKTHKR